MRTTYFGLAMSLLAFALGACTASNDPSTPEYWMGKLKDKRERIEALKELGKLADKKAVDDVKKWFQTEGEWQPDAAYTLGQLNDKSVVGDLIAGLDFQVGSGTDRITRNRNRTNINISRALAMLEATEGVEPLIRLVDTPEARVREAVIRSLGELGDSKATKALTEAAMNDKEPFIRKTAVQALGELGDEKAVPTLVQMLFVEAPGISFYNEARFSLVQLGQPAVPLLLKTMDRQNLEVEAVRMRDGSKILPGAVEAKAASVLGAMQAPEAEEPMIANLAKFYKELRQNRGPISASVPGAVVELSYALSNLGSKKAIPTLLEIAKDSDANIRLAATESLTALGDKQAVAPLLALSKTGDLNAQRAAITAVSRLGSGADLPAFDALAGGDKALQEIIQAERSRLVAAGVCQEDATCWRKKLEDADSRVRERAAYQLGWMRDKEAMPVLLKAAEDDDAQVRMAAVLSLSGYSGVEASALMDIHDKWKNKIDYAGVNQEILRVVARIKNRTPKKAAVAKP